MALDADLIKFGITLGLSLGGSVFVAGAVYGRVTARQLLADERMRQIEKRVADLEARETQRHLDFQAQLSRQRQEISDTFVTNRAFEMAVQQFQSAVSELRQDIKELLRLSRSSDPVA
jgi:hypothetical protein